MTTAWVLAQVLLLPDTASEATPCEAPYLLEKKDSLLQRSLTERLEARGFADTLLDQKLAVAVVDLTRRGKRYYAGVNDKVMMYAASLPKIAILLAVIEAANKGQIEWTHEFDQRLLAMIVDSNNEDASWGTDLVGLLAIEEVVRDPRYCLYNDEEGGLWVGRAYRSGGATNRDPLNDISHGATAHQTARFYTMLDAGYLVSRHWSFRMLGFMSPPTQFHKFVGALSTRPGVIFLARKSGTWHNFHADSALVQHQGTRYVLVGLAELKSGEQVLRDVAQIVDDLMMEGVHRKPRVVPQVRR